MFSDAKGLQRSAEIEKHRENVYGTLEEYCRTTYPEEPGRFAKLLLRLPALRSIGMIIYLCIHLSDCVRIYTIGWVSYKITQQQNVSLIIA